MIEVRNLTKRYGPHTAVDDISFSVSKGEVVGFLGPNGAGKSTTMNILTGYLSATEGDVTIDGTDILDEPEKVKRQIGYLPENPPLYTEMTVEEYLNFVCRIKHVPKAESADRIESGLDIVGIRDVFKRKIGNLSKGYRQRVGLAQALMGNPEILILDEPTAGLDPKQIIEIRELIRELGKDRTVILSSHILHEVAAICGRVMIINNGRIVADGEPDTIGESLFDANQMVLTAVADQPTTERIASSLSGATRSTVISTTEGTTEMVVESDRGADLRKEAFDAFAKAGVSLVGLRTRNMTLEEIFLELTSGVREVEESEAGTTETAAEATAPEEEATE